MSERIFIRRNGRLVVRVEGPYLHVSFTPDGFPPATAPTVSVTIRGDCYVNEVALSVIAGSLSPLSLVNIIDGGYRGLAPDAITNALSE